MTQENNKSLPNADRLQTLNEIGRVVSATLDPHALYETIYEQVGRVMDASQFFIALVAANGADAEIPYNREEGDLFLGQRIPLSGSVTGLVIERGIPLLFQSHANYQRYALANGLPEITVGQGDSEAMVWVPLNTGDRTIGAISVQSTRVNAYSAADMQTLLVIASQAAVAIENARLFDRSQESVRQMQALLQAAQSINASLELQTVLDSILSGMRAVMPYYLAAILLPDHTNQQLDIVGAVGPLADERREIIKVPFGRGVTGTVFSSGESLIVPNVHEFEGYITHGLNEVHSEMAVPLRRGDTVVGVLDVERKQADAFSAKDIDLMTLFASQAAIAIENARLFTEQQERVSDLQTIQSIVQKLTALHDIPAIAAVINRELKNLIDYHALRLFSLDEQAGSLTQIAYSGANTLVLHLKLGEGIAGWVAQQGESVLVPNTLEDGRVKQIEGTPRREESIMGAPLVYQGQVRGVITLSKLGANQFDGDSLRLLEIIAAQAAIAFDRAMLYCKLRTDAITDPLTRLYNRRYLSERFREEKSRALRNGHALTALMLDIDKFKRVNDTHGHDAGDVVLRELAALIRCVVRAEDLVARHGGEEFCVLLPEIPLVDAEIVADRLHRMIADHTMPAAAGVRHVTVSVGMAVLSPDDEENEIFTRADLAMYAVKRAGGNQMCVYLDDKTRFPVRGEARSG